MRFNDLIATALSARTDNARSRAILWRQCVDLFAQFDGIASDEELDQLAARLEHLRGSVDLGNKLAGLTELGGRLSSPRLVRLLLDDDIPVQVAAIRRARLPDTAWPAIITDAGPLCRSVLRQRDDMGPEARRALEAFGQTDLSLTDLTEGASAGTAPVSAAMLVTEAALVNEQSQIRRIVDRIERFTSERHERTERPTPSGEPPVHAVEPPAAPETAVSAFSFTTDVDGVVRSVEGAPSAMLMGLRFATPSLDRSVGPDGQILGAFRRRGAFRDGRLTIGEGTLAGVWLVEGDPQFDQRTGRFTGYRADARRAPDHAIAPFAAVPDEGAGNATSLRQLIHELRTPLSGVMGFAELIESQLLGPVDDRYRAMAEEIVADVRRLVDILDDLDLANRPDRHIAPASPRGADAGALLADAVARIGPDGQGRARIRLELEPDLPRVDVATTIVERIILHLVRALAGSVGSETLLARAHSEGAALLVEIDRPVAMASLTDTQLFDSSVEHVMANMDAPALGVGFALRLVRRLAQANRGGFSVHTDHVRLTLPVPGDVREQGATS